MGGFRIRDGVYAGAWTAVIVVAAGLASAVCAQPVPMHNPTPAPYATQGGAHARYSKAPIDLDPPNLALALALVTAGGGPQAFDAATLLGALTGNAARMQTERAALVKKFGAAGVATYEKVFAFAVADALAQVAAGGMTLPATPAPDPKDSRALAAALYTAGLTPRGTFDAEFMLDALFSHIVNVQVMNDIDAAPLLGFKADAQYHRVLSALILDLHAADKP